MVLRKSASLYDQLKRFYLYEPKSYHKPAAYTADGFMLPCCWLDDPKNDHGVEEKFHLKDEELALKNTKNLRFSK